MQVNSTRDLAHAYLLHNLGQYARSERVKSNVSYSGPLFYSRSTPVARAYKDRRGNTYLLACSEKYSPSTARQISQLSSAAHKLSVPVYHVPSIGAHGGWSSERPMVEKDMHASNFASMLAGLDNHVEHLKRCWKRFDSDSDTDWRWRFDYLRRMHADMVTYALGVDTPCDKLDCIERYIEAIEQYHADKRAAYADPKAVAKRERAHARYIAKQALGLTAVAA